MKTLLTPTDFSEAAFDALHTACDLARRTGAHVHALHVIEPIGGGAPSVGTGGGDGGMDQVFTLKLIEQAERYMEELKAASQFEGAKISTHVVMGSVLGSIETFAAHHGVDLIVIGTEGVGSLDETLVGSTTEKVVRRAACPVLSVRDHADEGAFAPRRILLPTDGNERVAELVKQVKTMQGIFDAHVDLLMVNTPGNFQTSQAMRQKLADFAERHAMHDYDTHVWNDRNTERGIMHFAEERGVDLIAMATHGRQGLAHLFRGSIAEDVVNQTPRPVLTVKID
ncbi:MAG: universal stress protein [Catalinimonas sp.]